MKPALLLFASLGWCLIAHAEAPNSIPNPRKTNHSSIYDGAGVLNNTEKHRIDDAINALEKKTGAQLMVAFVQTLGGLSIEKWSTATFKHIGIGHKGKNDGALFVFALSERRSRLEVGNGLRDRLTDARAKAILVQQVQPAFRAGQYGKGILDALKVASSIIQSGSKSKAGGAASHPHLRQSHT